jgi:hypothetical protein
MSDERIVSRIVKAADAAAVALETRRNGKEGLSDLLSRLEAPPSRHRWRYKVPITLAAATLMVGGAGAAVAHQFAGDPTEDNFRDLRPEKSAPHDGSVEPHALVEKIRTKGGGEVRLYATTKSGNSSCSEVQQFTAGGEYISSVSSCAQDLKSFSLSVLDGSVVGYVPTDEVSYVTVTGLPGVTRANVRYRYFLTLPAVVNEGEQVRVVGHGQNGNRVGEWEIRVGE